jgi:hypothetical protein
LRQAESLCSQIRHSPSMRKKWYLVAPARMVIDHRRQNWSA